MGKQSKNDKIHQSLNNCSTEYIKALQILTPREVEVLQGVAAGRTSREIAKNLNISSRTVQKHRQNVCKKLGLRGYRSLFKWCFEHINGVDEMG